MEARGDLMEETIKDLMAQGYGEEHLAFAQIKIETHTS